MGRNARPKGVFSAPFGFCFVIFAIAPAQIGYQDVAALVARQPMVTAHWREHVRTSAFGTIHAATFSFSRPIGTNMPRPLSYQLASLDPGMMTLAPWNTSPADADDPPLPFPHGRSQRQGRPAAGNASATARAGGGQSFGRNAGCERAAGRAGCRAACRCAETAAVPAEAVATKSEQLPATTPEEKPGAASEGEVKAEVTEGAENSSEDIPDPVDVVVADAPDFLPPAPEPVVEMARLYFGNEPFGDGPGVIEKWAPGEEPTIIAPAAPADPDIKLSALDPNRRRRKPRVAKASRRKAKSPARAGARCRRPSG